MKRRTILRYWRFLILGLSLIAVPREVRASESGNPPGEETAALASALGVHFIEGSTSSLILERDGSRYIVDLAGLTISAQETTLAVASAVPVVSQPATQVAGAEVFRAECASCHGADGSGLGRVGTPDLTDFRSRFGIPSQRIVDIVARGSGGSTMPAFGGRLSQAEIGEVAAFVQSLSGQGERADLYLPADDLVYSLPTGRPLPKGGVYINFTHRFVYNPAFSGAGLGNTLLGLDGFAVSSFGFRFGLSDRLSVGAYRSPSAIGRPIEFMVGYDLMDEYEDHPLNVSVRFSLDGQDNFRKNFTTNLEGIVSRSLSGRAQFYVVPTISFQNRRLVGPTGALSNRPADLPGINSASIGAGLAVNIRPSVAVVAEVIPTVYHGPDLGVHRPAYAIGVQKQIAGHAFTFGVSNSPGTVVAQRSGTRATFLGDPSGDLPGDLFFGFNLMRRLR